MVIGYPESSQANVVLLWLLFSMIAFCARSAKYLRRTRQESIGETKRLLIKRMQKETKEFATQRLKRRTKSIVRKERKATIIKNLGAMPQTNGNFKMRAYPYLQKESRNGKERRNSRVPVGITFEYIDRRQAGDSLYTGPERRSSMERRGLFWDRRKPKVPCYY